MHNKTFKNHIRSLWSDEETVQFLKFINLNLQLCFPFAVLPKLDVQQALLLLFLYVNPLLLQHKMAPSWRWTMSITFTKHLWIKNAHEHTESRTNKCGLWGGLVLCSHYVDISLVMSHCLCKTLVCYLWSCVYNPPVGAGTWPPRPRWEGRWGWGRRAAEGGTTRRCWWGLEDDGRKISQYRELHSYSSHYSIICVATTSSTRGLSSSEMIKQLFGCITALVSGHASSISALRSVSKDRGTPSTYAALHKTHHTY